MKTVRFAIVCNKLPRLPSCPFTVPSGPPTNLTAISLSSSYIKLTWMPPPPHNQNGIIREYTINYYVSETRERITKRSPENSTSAIVTDLHPYYTYSFQVAAVTIGDGPLSTQVTVRTLESGKTTYMSAPIK